MTDGTSTKHRGRWAHWGATGWRDIALLGLVSFVAEVSGEMMSAILPFILVTQGATGLAIGLVDGVTEGVGDLFKFVGGVLGQRVRRSRLLIAAGYLVASASRFGVAAAPTWPATLAARSMDRVGKGLRTAPRDAMLAGFVPAESRGRAFGLHLASDTAGGVVAVVLVLLLLGVGQAAPRDLVLLAAVIGLFAVIPLPWVRERSLAAPKEDAHGIAAAPEYGGFLLVACLFAAGRVSYLFYVVRATASFGRTGALLLYVAFVVLAAASAWLWGQLGDRWGKRRTLALGYLLSGVASAAMLLGVGLGPMVAAFAVLGIATGCVDGVSRALAAQVSGSTGRVARLGEYHAMTGFAGLLGSIAVGLLWDVGVQWAFLWGSLVPLLAVAGLAWLRRLHPHPWRKAAHPVFPD